MDIKQLAAELRAARKTIDKALKLIAELPDSESKSKSQKIGVCTWCKKDLLESDPIQRGVHTHCYNELYGFVRRGEKTLKQYEDAGILKPVKITGRPRKTYAEAVDQATNSDKPLKKMPRRKKSI